MESLNEKNRDMNQIYLFDTQEAIEDLEKNYGLSHIQAKGIVKTIGKISTSELATKADIKDLKSDIKEVRCEVKRLEDKIESEVNRLENKIESEVNRLENKIESEVNRLEHKIESEIKRLEHKIESEVRIIGDKIDKLFLRLTVQMAITIIATISFMKGFDSFFE